MAFEKDWDYFFKLVTIGDIGVGKSNLLTLLSRNSVDLNSKSTRGIEFYGYTTKIPIYGRNWTVMTRIWDTAGIKEDRATTSSYYRDAGGALLVYDVTNRESFDNVEQWLKTVRMHADYNIVVMLVGNKCDSYGDINRRQVTVEEGIECSKKYGLPFFETSCIFEDNVRESWKTLVTEILKKKVQ